MDMAGRALRATDPAGGNPDNQLTRLRGRVCDLVHFERGVATYYGCTHSSS